MKCISNFVVVILISFAVLYGLFSFCVWDTNPEKWSNGTRVFYCILCVISLIISYGMWIEADAKHRNMENHNV